LPSGLLARGLRSALSPSPILENHAPRPDPMLGQVADLCSNDILRYEGGSSMKKLRLVCVILGGFLLALGFTQCDMGTTGGSLSITACDGGPEAGCPVRTTPTPSGW
jgi:hypothetical protein